MAFTLTTDYVPGCIGRVVQLHADYYARSNGFGLPFEAKVAQELAAFCSARQTGRDALWLVLDDRGAVQGSIAIDGSRAAREGAHLRWFITSDVLRGQGLGRRLLDQALSFADACGYAHTYLWTFAGLDAARHLYEAAGFRRMHQEAGSQWGVQVLEQRWERGLGGGL